MRIAILTQYFPPEMGAPQARLYELAVRLQARGHELTVITAMPNYPTGAVAAEYRGRVFCRERMGGLRVIRTPIFPSKSTKLLVRLASYMSFVVTSLLLGTWAVGHQDLLIVESPPLFLGLSGIPMSRIVRARMILMVSDIWPDVAVRMGNVISDKQARILERLEAFLYRRSACVALTNPGAVEQVKNRFPEVPCSTISNGVDTSLFHPGLRSERVRKEMGIQPGQFAAAYCGLHGVFQGLEVVIDAARRLGDHQRIRFVMIGDGPLKEPLMDRARKAGLQNVIFQNRQPRERIPEILASMDASLVPLAASLPGTMPSKVYEALGAGIPILATRGCEAEQLIRRHGVGRVFDAGDSAQLAEQVLELSSNPSLHRRMCEASRALAQRFDRDTIADRTEELLRAVADGRALPSVDW